METQALIYWIASNFQAFSNQINKIAIYGSIARNSNAPNDCDLLIVSSASVQSKSWLSLRKHINFIKSDFAERFKFPINVALLTEGEWNENKSFYKDLLEVTI